jgi:cell wall-associated NlpC family hydrolase
MKKFVPFGLCVAFCLSISLSTSTFAQQSRPRLAPGTTQNTVLVVPSANNQSPASRAATQQPLVKSSVMSQPRGQAPRVLTNDIYVRPTASTRPANAASAAALNAVKTSTSSSSAGGFRGRMLQAMNNWIGTPYGYGSEGPNRIDCSALVWRVFTEAGIGFDRTSARNYWSDFPVASETEQTQFGTLVFFNSLGHVGIVIDENTFFHASSSKGVTFSKFDGYWSKRIVGYRRIPLNQIPAFLQPENDSTK